MFDESGPGAANFGVLVVGLGICLHHFMFRLLDRVGSKHLGQPGVDAGEEAIVACMPKWVWCGRSAAKRAGSGGFSDSTVRRQCLLERLEGRLGSRIQKQSFRA